MNVPVCKSSMVGLALEWFFVQGGIFVQRGIFVQSRGIFVQRRSRGGCLWSFRGSVI